MPLLIAMPAPLPPDFDAADASTAAIASLPAMPALTRLLHGARRLPAASGWRAGVLAALLPRQPAVGVAEMAARAVPEVAPDSAVCLAAPVHAVAGMSRMHLAPGSLLVQGEEEREMLRQSFNSEFGSPQLQLHAAGSGWLLAGNIAGAADDASPETLIGRSLERAPAVSAAQRSLRRLGAEVEMWLAAHPVNAARNSRGLAAVNCFWFSDGTSRRELPAPAVGPLSVLASGAPPPWLAGLARHCNASLAGSAVRLPDPAAKESRLIVLEPPPDGDPVRFWNDCDASWFAPLARSSGGHGSDDLQLQIGCGAWQVRHDRLFGWLRRARPWWREVSA
jgi:hypothetical protein